MDSDVGLDRKAREHHPRGRQLRAGREYDGDASGVAPTRGQNRRGVNDLGPLEVSFPYGLVIRCPVGLLQQDDVAFLQPGAEARSFAGGSVSGRVAERSEIPRDDERESAPRASAWSQGAVGNVKEIRPCGPRWWQPSVQSGVEGCS